MAGTMKQAWRLLYPEQLARPSEADPAALAVEPAIHQFLPGQLHDIHVAMMDRHEEPGVENLEMLSQIAVDALRDAFAAHAVTLRAAATIRAACASAAVSMRSFGSRSLQMRSIAMLTHSACTLRSSVAA